MIRSIAYTTEGAGSDAAQDVQALARQFSGIMEQATTEQAPLQESSGQPQQPGQQGTSQAGGGGKWTPVNEKQINALIKQALNDNHGDVSKAFAELRDQRDKPANYYNTNLAIAEEYLRARYETQRSGPEVATEEVMGYMGLKRAGKMPQTGPGPESPYSSVAQKYMLQGVKDQESKMSIWERFWWASPEGQTVGLAYAAKDNLGELGYEG